MYVVFTGIPEPITSKYIKVSVSDFIRSFKMQPSSIKSPFCCSTCLKLKLLTSEMVFVLRSISCHP